VSQPCDKQSNVPLPGELDPSLNEFWVGNAFDIFQEHNLSSFERNRTYLNSAGEGFLDISFISGADIDSDSRSVLALDTQNRGQLDLLLRQAGGGPFKILENQFPSANYLKVSLKGVKSNRLGIGSRLIAHVGDRRIVRELYPINSYRSQHPAHVHFGLATAEKVDRLVIEWPSGRTQEFIDLPINRHLVLEENEPGVQNGSVTELGGA